MIKWNLSVKNYLLDINKLDHVPLVGHNEISNRVSSPQSVLSRRRCSLQRRINNDQMTVSIGNIPNTEPINYGHVSQMLKLLQWFISLHSRLNSDDKVYCRNSRKHSYGPNSNCLQCSLIYEVNERDFEFSYVTATVKMRETLELSEWTCEENENVKNMSTILKIF